MKNGFVMVFAGLAASTLLVGAEQPTYVRLGALSSQGDLRAYAGGKAMGYGLEIGHNLGVPGAEIIGLDVFAGFMKINGDPSGTFGGLKQNLQAWRLGTDIRFSTPLEGLTPYAGINMNYFQGKRLNGGSVKTYDGTFSIDAGNYGERKGKFGYRIGLEYRINRSWGVSLDFSQSEWFDDYAQGDHEPMTGERAVKGLNPINPSWLSFSVQYRFDTVALLSRR